MEGFIQHRIVTVEDALARMANRKPLYARLLGNFLADPRENELIAAIEGRDLDAAVMAAHTVKGMASNLSLTRLHKCAEALEGMFKQAKTDGDSGVFDSACAAEVRQVFRDTVDAVAAVIPTLQ